MKDRVDLTYTKNTVVITQCSCQNHRNNQDRDERDTRSGAALATSGGSGRPCGSCRRSAKRASRNSSKRNWRLPFASPAESGRSRRAQRSRRFRPRRDEAGREKALLQSGEGRHVAFAASARSQSGRRVSSAVGQPYPKCHPLIDRARSKAAWSMSSPFSSDDASSPMAELGWKLLPRCAVGGGAAILASAHPPTCRKTCHFHSISKLGESQ